ncbi:MAG: type II toxin-antitoxin system VapC family toxin [Fidelibacterota bacterium]
MRVENLVFLNTDILTHSHDLLSTLHPRAVMIRKLVAEGKIKGCVSPGILNEFFSIVTDPRAVRNPIDPETAIEELRKYLLFRKIVKIFPKGGTPDTTIRLVDKYRLRGSDIFDAEIVAVMIDNDVKVICTFDIDSFRKFTEIEILNPIEMGIKQTTFDF